MDGLIAELMQYQNADRATTARVLEIAQGIRNAALEEAANAIEGYDTAQCDTGWGPSTGDLAETIRALKGAAAPE